MGASPRWVLTKHVWRKILPVIVVTTANAMSLSLLIVASLTFLGIGVVPPNPTWGGMLATDLAYLHQRPYGPLFPSLLVMVSVGALNYIADSISDSAGDAGRARRSGAGRPRAGRPPRSRRDAARRGLRVCGSPSTTAAARSSTVSTSRSPAGARSASSASRAAARR